MLLVPGLMALLAAAGAPQALVTPDERGLVREVRVGQHLFLTDLGVSLTAPGWGGTRGDQRALKPEKVERAAENGATALTAVLESPEARTRLRQTLRPIEGGARLEYELTPERDVQVENVMLGGRVPVEGNAGRTRYVAAGEDVLQGVCPAELNGPAYCFLGSRALDWLALVADDGSALRLAPQGLNIALQDDRKWKTPAFGLQASVAGGTLKAGQTIRFALEITATTGAAVEASGRQAAQTALAGIALSSAERLRAGKVAVDRASVSAFERVELTPEIAAAFDNPFDPEDVSVDAKVTLPGGKKVSVPGFYYVPLRVEMAGSRERLSVAGPACWKVRYTPTAPGTYRAVVTVRDRSGKASCPPATFKAAPSKHPGFIRVSKQSPGYFCRDSGAPYFAVGENVCWAGASAPVQNYTDWFRGLGAGRGNWARLWLASNEKGLEWMPAPTAKAGRGTYLGLGRYALDNAWRLDEVVRLARENGVALMFCIGTYGELKADAGYFGEGSWVSNPYNAANGGPCASPKEFETDPTARKLYQRRLRYILARWGYSPDVFAWEFWNEHHAPAAWVGEMAAYLKRHDVNRHLVSTTYGDDAAWKLPDVDFSMTHDYGDSGNVSDFTDRIVSTAHAHRKYGKPYFLAEFGIDWRTSDSKYDPEGKGQNLHNGLWASVLSGGAGTAMLWYWDGYVHPKNLYSTFTPVARFVAGVDWARTRFEPVEGIALRRVGGQPERFTDLEISPGFGWGKQGDTDYTLRRDGTIGGGPVAGTIGSPARHTPSELHTRLTFHLDMPADGEFIAKLGTVSGKARLQVRVDDALVADEPLSAGPEGQGSWKSSRHLKEWDVWQSDYDRDIAVKVPAGKHTVALGNAEGDWLSLRGYRIPAYRSSRYPDAHALALRSDRLLLLWLHHRASTWRAVLDGKEPETLADLRVAMPGIPGGAWQVEWWDTYAGKVLRTDAATAGGGTLELAPPPFARDVAARIRR